MDRASQQGAQLMSALAAANERLVDLAIELRARPSVKSVLNAVSLRSYRSGPMLEAYVDATGLNGDNIGYWLELSWTADEWVIGTSIAINRANEEYQDTLQAFPERRIHSLADLV